MSKLLPEFPTEWHQDVYREGLERELEGYKRRMGELELLGLGEGDPAWDHAAAGVKATESELKRVGKPESKPAAKKAPAKKKAAAKK